MNRWHCTKIAEEGTSLECDVYSDPERTNLVATLSLTLHGDHSFRYVYGCSTSNSGDSFYMNADIENLRLREVEPSLNDATYMHGKHSWYVEGSSNSDAVVEQTLRSEVVQYIRNRVDGQNRGVCFSFWYRPDGALSDGSKNQACAKIVCKDGSEHLVNGLTAEPNTSDPGDILASVLIHRIAHRNHI